MRDYAPLPTDSRIPFEEMLTLPPEIIRDTITVEVRSAARRVIEARRDQEVLPRDEPKWAVLDLALWSDVKAQMEEVDGLPLPPGMTPCDIMWQRRWLFIAREAIVDVARESIQASTVVGLDTVFFSIDKLTMDRTVRAARSMIRSPFEDPQHPYTDAVGLVSGFYDISDPTYSPGIAVLRIDIAPPPAI